jgi:uncharacterized protein
MFPSITPVQQTERISVIDTIRGIAVLGILLMNIPYFANYYAVAENPFILQEKGKDYYTWLVVSFAFEGTMRGLFSLLFGAGAVLLLDRLEKNPGLKVTPADIYYRRLIWLLIFGLFNAFILLWPGDILYTYAICGLFLYPFRKMRPRALIIIGLMLMLVTTYKGSAEWYEKHEVRVKGEQALLLKQKGTVLKEEQQEALKAWANAQDSVAIPKMMKEKGEEEKAIKGGYLSYLAMVADVNQEIQSVEFYQFLFWDALAFFFIGMALFKLDVITGKRSLSFYWMLMVISLAIGYALSYQTMKGFIDVRMNEYYFWERIGLRSYQFRRLAQALGYMSLIILLFRYNVLSFLWKWLGKVGQMAFSNYLMQQIICGMIFYGFGFNKYGEMARHEVYYVLLAIWVSQIIFSNIWLHYFRFGPFEWLWRSLTYWEKQPIRRL